MSALPSILDPSPGSRGFATDDRASLAHRVVAAWELWRSTRSRPTSRRRRRTKGRTGRDVLAPVGRWSDSRGFADVVADARAGRTGRIDQEAYEQALRVSHRQASPTEVVASVRAAGAEVEAWLGSAEDDSDGLMLTSTPLGAMPIRTFVHAAVYQLAVVALDLEGCSPTPAPDPLLGLGLVALVDSTGCLAARRGLDASLVADARTDAPDHRGGGVWGFGAADGAWCVAELGEPEGPAITATTRVVLDITAGRTANVPGLVASGALRLHDVPGLLRLAPLVDEVPGIPGASALKAATISLNAASAVLGRLRRPFG